MQRLRIKRNWYRFIYPEDLRYGHVQQNIAGTTVQAELTYRPDFPLATNGGDQGQQISDAAGTTQLLSIGVGQGVRGACALQEDQLLCYFLPNQHQRTAKGSCISKFLRA